MILRYVMSLLWKIHENIFITQGTQPYCLYIHLLESQASTLARVDRLKGKHCPKGLPGSSGMLKQPVFGPLIPQTQLPPVA